MAGRFLFRALPRLSAAAAGTTICRPLIRQAILASSPKYSVTSSQLVFSKQFSAAAEKFECINIQDSTDFQRQVLENATTPVVVDFHATWCGPCKLLGPRLESIVGGKSGKVILAKVDIDDNPELAMKYGVRSVPTVIGVKKGEVLDQFVGCKEDDEIDTFVEKLIIN